MGCFLFSLLNVRVSYLTRVATFVFEIINNEEIAFFNIREDDRLNKNIDLVVGSSGRKWLGGHLSHSVSPDAGHCLFCSEKKGLLYFLIIRYIRKWGILIVYT